MTTSTTRRAGQAVCLAGALRANGPLTARQRAYLANLLDTVRHAERLDAEHHDNAPRMAGVLDVIVADYRRYTAQEPTQ